jgi:single-stranded DNA-binding protein
MIDGLVTGKLHGKPQQRRASNGGGRVYVTATVRCAGGEGEAVFVNAVAFSDSAKAALLALEDGDPVALCGSLSVGIWQPEQGAARPQVRLTVTGLLSPYHVTKRRAAVQQARQPQPGHRAPQDRLQAAPAGGGLSDDELDF